MTVSSVSEKSVLFYFRYFINFLLDTTIGLVIIWLCIKITSILAQMKNWRSLRFGEYGKVPYTAILKTLFPIIKII